ncbi:MAG TPA: protein kinase [Polyangiaceae bacterium]
MEAPVQEGDLLAGKYRVEKILGFGGMGVVVSAFRGDLEQRVAVKFLSQQAAERPDAAERFRREARAAAKIRSEHVARVLDVGTLDTGLPFMVMEYLEGNDIADELRRCERLPMLDAVEFTLQAIEALAEAHANGVVHRDLKPGNLFLARRADGSRRVKVLDFGISKALGGTSVEELSLTKTAALIGSPLYMAPEQMRSAKDVDTRADIWSLGAMLYEMLTGQPPYTGDSIPQLCAALLHDEPIPLRQHRPEVPEGLEQAVLRCLRKDRNERFPTVYDLGRSLVPFAMPGSHIHVERAERVLGATGINVSGRPPVASQVTSSLQSAPAYSRPITPLASTPQYAVTPQPISDPTVNSWGNSGVGKSPRRRGPLLVIGAVAAVLAGALGLWAARNDDDTAKSPQPAATAVPGAAELAKTEPKPSPAEPAPLVHPSPTEPAVAAPPTERAASSATPTPPAPAAAAPPKHRPAVAVAKPAAKPAKPVGGSGTPASTGAVITDFGGRR